MLPLVYETSPNLLEGGPYMYLNLKYAQSRLVVLACIVFFGTPGCRSVPPPPEIALAFDHSSAEVKDKYSLGMRQLFTSGVTGVASGLFLGAGLYCLGHEINEPAPESKRYLLISLPLLGVGYGFFVPLIVEETRSQHSFPEATAAYNEDLRQRLQLSR
jgi:hypothetical protein